MKHISEIEDLKGEIREKTKDAAWKHKPDIITKEWKKEGTTKVLTR